MEGKWAAAGSPNSVHWGGKRRGVLGNGEGDGASLLGEVHGEANLDKLEGQPGGQSFSYERAQTSQQPH